MLRLHSGGPRASGRRRLESEDDPLLRRTADLAVKVDAAAERNVRDAATREKEHLESRVQDLWAIAKPLGHTDPPAQARVCRAMLAACERLSAHRPFPPRFYVACGWCLEQLGERARALIEYEQYLAVVNAGTVSEADEKRRRFAVQRKRAIECARTKDAVDGTRLEREFFIS